MTLKLATYHCKRCMDTWTAPDASEVAWWQNLSQQRHHFLPEMGWMHWMEKHTDFASHDIKCITLHRPRDGGKCCNCDEKLGAAGLVECGHCKSINFAF